MRRMAVEAILDANGNFPSLGLKPGEEVKIKYPGMERMNSQPIKSVVVQETGRVVVVKHSFHGPWGHPHDYTDTVAKASLYAGEHELIRLSTGEKLGRCNHAVQ